MELGEIALDDPHVGIPEPSPELGGAAGVSFDGDDRHPGHGEQRRRDRAVARADVDDEVVGAELGGSDQPVSPFGAESVPSPRPT